MSAAALLGALLSASLLAQAPAPDARALARMIAAEPAAGRQAIVDRYRPLVTHDLIEALLDEGDATVKRADLQSAFALSEFTAHVADEIGDVSGSIEAAIFSGVIFGRKADYVSAMASFRGALDRATAAGQLTAQTQALNNMGIVHRRLGELDLSLADYARSLALAERIGDLPKQANTLNNIGIVLVQQGKYRSASTYYERSLEIKRRLKTWDVMTTIVNLGELYEQQGDVDLALKNYHEGLDLADGQGDRLETLGPLRGIGRVLLRRGQFADALEYFGRALSIAERATDRDAIAFAEYNIGVVLRQQGRMAEARARFNQSLALRDAIGDTAGQAESLIQIALVEVASKQYENARVNAGRAAEIAGRVGHRVERWKALTIVGQAEQALGHDAAARTSLVDATSDIEAMRDEVAGGDEATQRFFEWRLDPYYALIDLHVAAGRAVDALAVAERVRGRVLLDALRFGRVDVTKSMTADERERERRVTRDVATAKGQLETAQAGANTPKGDVERLAAALASARLTQTGYQADLYAAHPDLKTHRGEVPDVQLADVLQLLPAGQSAALEFAVTAERTYLFVVRRRGAAADVSVFTVRITKEELSDRVQRFRQKVSTRDLNVRADARALYDVLLGPAAAVIADCTSLIVLPDGPLWALPFQALETPARKYLIEQADVSYAPSLAALREMHRLADTRAAGQTRLPLLSMGSSGAESRAVTLGGLPLLPAAEAQARAIASVYGAGRSTIRVGADARSDWLQRDVNRYQVIHIAAHGIFDDVSPMHSYLVLAPASASPGVRDDGYLEAADLINMDIQADLVVLSSCDTALGRIGDGEGLVGLSWALFVAGTPSIVVSQWQVAADSTTELMRVFHRKIADGLKAGGAVSNRAVALRAAALSLIKTPQRSHPFYWAPFVLIGDGT